MRVFSEGAQGLRGHGECADQEQVARSFQH